MPANNIVEGKINEKQKTKKLLLLLLLLLLLIGLAFFFIRRTKTVTGIVEENNPLLMQKIDNNQTDEENTGSIIRTSPDIVLPGFSDLTIKANTADVQLIDNLLYNPEENAYYNCPVCNSLLEDMHCPKCNKTFKAEEAKANKYYLLFEIYLKDKNEKIYASDLVCPGYHINNLRLSRPLEVGDYNASIVIRPFRTDMISECNTGALDITLHVTDTI